MGVKRFRWLDIAYGVVGFLIYLGVLMIITSIIKAQAPDVVNQRQNIGFDRHASGLTLVPIFMSLVVLPPLLEETIFRGFLYSGVRKYFPAVGATLLTSVVFAAAHLLGGETNALLWIAAIDTFLLSLTLCYLREKTGRLWAPMLVHGFKNLLAFSALFIFSRH